MQSIYRRTFLRFAAICLFLMALSRMPSHAVAEERMSVWGLSFSPDGTMISFARDAGDGAALFCVNADGTNLRHLAWDATIYGISWSADGKRITYGANLDSGPKQVMAGGGCVVRRQPSQPKFRVYARNYGRMSGPSHIWRRPIGSSSPPVRLTSGPNSDSDPVLSPDGRWIVFTSDRQPEGLWIMRPDGSGIRCLAPNGSSDAAWSPDSSLVAFTRGEERVHVTNMGLDSYVDDDVWVVRPDGKGMRRLTYLGQFWWDGTVSSRAWPLFCVLACTLLVLALASIAAIIHRLRAHSPAR